MDDLVGKFGRLQVGKWPPPLVESLMTSLIPEKRVARYMASRTEAYDAGDYTKVKQYDRWMFKALAIYAVRRGKAAEALLQEGLARIINSNPHRYTRWYCERGQKYLRMISKP